MGRTNERVNGSHDLVDGGILSRLYDPYED